MASPFSVFRHRNFTLLWIAQFVSTIGNGLLIAAASILVFRMTGSAKSVGLVFLATAMPSLVVGFVAGVAVDRFNRKRIMLAANLLCALIVAAIPMVLRHDMVWLYGLVALSSAVEQFFAPAQASVLPETVPEEERSSANAMMTVSLYGAVTIGYAAAGLIATVSTLTTAFLLDALSFLLSAACILRVRVVPLPARREATAASPFDNFRAGLAFVRDKQVLRAMVLVFGALYINYGLTNALLLPFIKRALNGSDFHYTLTEAVFAVGFVIGSFMMANLSDRLHPGQWIVISNIGMGLFTIGLATGQSLMIAILCCTMNGLLNAPSYLGRQLLIQRTTSREMLGRVSSVFFVLSNTGYMLGMSAAGLADIWDVSVLLRITGIGLLVCGVLALVLPGLGQPTAEWRRVVAMLRSRPEASAVLGLGRAATLADVDQLCRQLPALSHWSRAARKALAVETRVFEVEPGTTIVHQGEQTSNAYFVLEGRTVATQKTGGGENRILAFHNPGDLFGEIAALTRMPRTANVLAAQTSLVLQVPARVLRHMGEDPRVHRVLFETMNERLRVLNLLQSPGFTGLANRP